MFKNRYDAAKELARKLEKYRNANGVVLAVPRGGVPIGDIMAKELELPLEVILSKKIGHPNNPEFVIGSVSLNGAVVDDCSMDVSLEYIKQETERITKELKEKYKLYLGDCLPTDLQGKTVIVVDDGIVTGNTLLATVEAIKKSKPKKIILAVPVGPLSTIKKLSKFVDELVCLYIPKYFQSVGQFYEDFSTVNDGEVIHLLRESNKVKSVA